jgi:LysR family transcriptional regulator, regulator of abg operon
MKFNQLRDFAAVAEIGSLRGASRALGLAQPAITRSIRELEHSLGAQLFIREARGVRLTPIGETFRLRAVSILGDIRRAQEAVSQQQESIEGQLVVGLSVAAHLGIASDVMPAFHRRYPKVRLRLIEGFLPTLESDLKTGLVDLYVGPVFDGTETPDLQITRLFDNERVVVARKGHPMKDAGSLAELVGEKWVTTSITHDAEDELNIVFRLHGLPEPTLGGQAQSALSILTMLLNSDMLAMMPVQWVEFPILKEWLEPINLAETFSAPPIVLVHKPGLGLTPAGEYFAHLVQRAAVKQIDQ